MSVLDINSILFSWARSAHERVVVVIFHSRSSFLRSEGNDRLADVDRTVCASGILLDKPADNKRKIEQGDR